MSPTLDEEQARHLVAGARVARLATTNSSLGVDIVPVTFALLRGDAGDRPDRIVTAVDHKPKATTRLRRLRNIAEHPEVTVLVDHYENDWERLWWVRLRGVASIVTHGPAFDEAVDALVDRYEQYRIERPAGPVIDVAIAAWTTWKAQA
jgi:PPOX class probable F420-dependent enzyme